MKFKNSPKPPGASGSHLYSLLATQEAEIQEGHKSQPRQIVHETLSQKYPTQNKPGGVA
jgi:hypothetical protein